MWKMRRDSQKKQQITASGTDTTLYAYTPGDRLSTISQPSGSVVGYIYNTNGQISAVQVTPVSGSAQTVASTIAYLPFGPISSYTLGNGQTVTRSYDANYALTDLASPALNLHLGRDPMGQVVALGNAPGASSAIETYSYDPLRRLTAVTDGSTAIASYTYTPTGDRLSNHARATWPSVASSFFAIFESTEPSLASSPAASGNQGMKPMLCLSA